MKVLKILFWMTLILSTASLVLTFNAFSAHNLAMFFIIFFLLTIEMYLLESQLSNLRKISQLVEKIDLFPLKNSIEALKKERTEYLLKTFKNEMELGELRQELSKIPSNQETKYREIARKVLELDNKMNEKFNLLGEAILKLKGKKR